MVEGRCSLSDCSQLWRPVLCELGMIISFTKFNINWVQNHLSPQMYEPWNVKIVSSRRGVCTDWLIEAGRGQLSVTVEEHFKYNLENDPIWTGNINSQHSLMFPQFLEKMWKEYLKENSWACYINVVFWKMKTLFDIETKILEWNSDSNSILWSHRLCSSASSEIYKE